MSSRRPDSNPLFMPLLGHELAEIYTRDTVYGYCYSHLPKEWVRVTHKCTKCTCTVCESCATRLYCYNCESISEENFWMNYRNRRLPLK